MANTSRKSSITKESHNLNTNWLNNAMRSIGASVAKNISDTAPTLTEIVSTSAKTARNVTQSMRSGRASMSGITSQLENNKYVKFAKTVYKNSLEDIRSGNLNNTERDMFGGLDGDSSSSGFSFDDEDMDGESGNVNLNVDTSGLGESIGSGFASLSDSMNRQSEVMVKTAEANMKAQLAMNSANMFQNQKNSQEVLNHLSNINSQLSSLVSYNQETMTKYVESSMAFYEKMGSSLANDSSDYGNNKISPDSLFGSNGKFNIRGYKDYIKQSLKGMSDKSGLGLVNSLLDENTLGMIAANPLGMGMDMVVKMAMPKMFTQALTSMEESFTNLTANTLHSIADWGDSNDGTTSGKIKQFIGNAFGIKGKREKSYNKSATIKNGPIPFDNETKTAITQVITKELTTQTSYLKLISENMATRPGVGASKRTVDEGDIKHYNYSNGKYQTTKEITAGIVNDVRDSILSEMSNTKFGETIKKDMLDRQGDINSNEYKAMEQMINKFMLLAMKEGGAVNLRDNSNKSRYTSIKKELGNSKAASSLIKYLDQLDSLNPSAADNLSVAILKGTAANNNKVKDITSNPDTYGLFNAEDLIGDETHDQLYERMLSSVASNKYKRTNVNGFTGNNSYDASSKSATLSRMTDSITKRGRAFAGNIVHGNLQGANNDIGKLIGDQVSILTDVLQDKLVNPLKNTLFGKKNEQGARENGLFASAMNTMADLTAHLKYQITGKAYRSRSGEQFEDKEDSVLGQFRVLGTKMKKLIFGSKEKDADGNITSSTEGLVQKVTGSVKAGFNGWMDAFFGPQKKPGQEMTEEEYSKQTKENQKQFMDKVKKNLPAGITGAAGGIGFGSMAGGLLGNLVGGPIGGAILGTALGFATKSKGFMEAVFGAKDEDGTQLTEGLISSKVQKYFKDNKAALGGASAAGLVIGSVKGAGLLGNLVGGPIGGALLGLGAGVIAKSNMFKTFLFGDEEKGQRGIFNIVKDSFGKFSWGLNGDAQGTGKMLGMAGLGAGAGAITMGSLLSSGILGLSLGPAGPIGGAVLGLGLSIAAQKDNFRTWLFGEKDENGKKTKEGVLGQAKNAIYANLISPLANSLTDLKDGMAHFIEYGVLDGIRFAFQPLTDAVASIGHKLQDKANKLLSKAGAMLKENIMGPITKFIFKPITTIADKSVKLINFALNKVVIGINEKFRALTNKVSDFFSNIKEGAKNWLRNSWLGKKVKGAKDAVVGTARNVKNGIKGGISNVAKGVSEKWKASKAGKFTDKINKQMEEAALANDDLDDETYRRLIQRIQNGEKLNRTDEARIRVYERHRNLNNMTISSAERKKHTQNAQLIAKYTNNQFGKDTTEGREALVKALQDQGMKEKDIAKITSGFKDFDAIQTKEEALKKKQEADEQERVERERAQLTSTQHIENMVRVLGGFEDRQSGSEGSSESGNNNPPKPPKKKNRRERRQSIREARRLARLGIVPSAHNLDPETDENDNAIDTALNEGDVPGHADGTDAAKAGLTVIGEKGAELVHMNGGEKVIPHDKAKAYLDKAKAGYNDAKERGLTVSEKLAQMKESKQAQWMKDMLATSKEHLAATAEHAKEWGSTFNIKKGIIALLVLKFGPMIMNLLKNIDWESVIGVISKGIETIEEVVKGIAEQFGWTQKEHALKDGDTIGDRVVANKERGASILDENGNWDHQSEARLAFGLKTPTQALYKGAKYVNKKFINRGIANNNIFKRASAVKTVGNKLFNKSAKNVVANGSDDAANYFATFAANNADNVAGAVANGGDDAANYFATFAAKNADNVAGAVASGGDDAIKATAAKIAEETAETATKGSKGILKTIIDSIGKFFSGIGEKISEKLGKKVATNSLDDVAKATTKFAESNADTVAAKAAPVITGKTATNAVVGIGQVINAGIITLSAINGATGAARLFQVDQSAVKPGMVAVAAIIGAFAGTLIGGIADVINELMADITGVSLFNTVAVAMYKFFANDADDEALTAAQQAFKDEYVNYKGAKISDQYESMKAGGLIDANMSEEDFRAKVDNGEIKASYDSFIDYNNDKHKTLLSRAGDAIVSGAKTVKSFYLGDKTKTYTDESTGIQYIQNPKDGTFKMVDKDGITMKGSDGKDLYVNEDMIKDKGYTLTTERHGGGGLFGLATRKGKETGAKVRKGLSEIGATLTKKFAQTDAAKALVAADEKAKGMWDAVINTKDDIFTSIKEKGIVDTIKELRDGKLTKSLFSKKTTIYRDATNSTNYYKYDEANKCWNYYNATDSIVESKSGIKQEEMDKLVEANLVIQDEYVEDTEIKKTIDSVKTKMKNTITTAGKSIGQAASNAWDKLKNFFGGGSGTGNTAASTLSNITVNNNYNNMYSPSNNIRTGRGLTTYGAYGKGRKFGGGRGDTLNGFEYESQEDPQWADAAYGNDGATMGDSGCGPTAMSMIASHFGGNGGTSPTDMANLAQMTGDRDETGTNWNFIDNASSAYGLNNTSEYMPSSDYIAGNLANGNPMILSGASGSGRKGGRGNVPYTDAGHYVVATGIDNNGNVMVNDPRGKQYSGKYDINDLTNSTDAAWAFGGQGRGRGGRGLKRFGGRGFLRRRGGRGGLTPGESQIIGYQVKQPISCNYGAIKDYWLFRPNASTDTKLPLVIFLHGLGEVGGSVYKLAGEKGQFCGAKPWFPQYVYDGEMFANCVIIAPHLASGDWATNHSSLMSLINEVVETQNINPDKISITGQSLGGIGTADSLAKEQNFFSCGVIMCGVCTTARAQKIINTPVLCFTGTEDSWSRPSMEAAVKVINDAGGWATLYLVNGKAHDTIVPMYKVYDTLKWMITKTRGNAHQTGNGVITINEGDPLTNVSSGSQTGTAGAGTATVDGNYTGTSLSGDGSDNGSSSTGSASSAGSTSIFDTISNLFTKYTSRMMGGSGNGHKGGRGSHKFGGRGNTSATPSNYSNYSNNSIGGMANNSNYKQMNPKRKSNKSFGGFGVLRKPRSLRRGGRGIDDGTVLENTQGVTANDVINVAKNEVGYVEKATNDQLDDKKANPGTLNYTKYGVITGTNGQFWCASFVSWCVYTAAGNNKSLATQIMCGSFSASCQTILNAMRKAQRASNSPQLGDFVFFKDTHGNNETGHIGIVTDISGNGFKTIEGNTSDKKGEQNGGCVKEKTYSSKSDGSIVAFGHPIYAGTSANLYTPTSSGTGSDGSDSSGANVSSGNGGIFGIFSKVSEVFERITSKLFGGSTSSDSSDSGDGSDSSSSYNYTGATTSSANLTGSDNGQKIFNYLTTTGGLSKIAAAGLMGNLHCESGLQPNNLQDSGNRALGVTDQQYTDNVDSGSYDRFVDDQRGYGLAQWTSAGRKANLYSLAKQRGTSISDLATQLDYLNSELNGGYKSKVRDKIANAASIKEASNVVLHKFEAPADQSASVENTRAGYGETMLKLYGGGSDSTTQGGQGRGRRGGNGTRKRRGGRGAAVTSTTPNLSANQSFNPSEANQFITSVASGSSSNIDLQYKKLVIAALTAIAENTGLTSEQLKSLRDLSNTISNNGNTTNIITPNGSNKTTPVVSNNSESRNSVLAKKIASGK